MYEAVHVLEEGRTTTARFAATLLDAGYDGMIVAADAEDTPTYDAAAVQATYDVDLVDGLEITSEDGSVVSGAVSNYRRETTVILVRGETQSINRYAVETPAVDVLRDPTGGDGDVNHVLVKAAVSNDVFLEVNLGPALRTSGGPRVQALRKLRKLRELIESFDAPYVVSADPETHLQVRAPREIVAVGEEIGFSAAQIRAGFEAWETIVARNRERLSEEYVGEGVRTGRDSV
ncbi:MAG: RNase P subunit p30 family protein [Halanaeroarchaeum sp.]